MYMYMQIMALPDTFSVRLHPTHTPAHASQSLQLPHPPHRVPRQPHIQTKDSHMTTHNTQVTKHTDPTLKVREISLYCNSTYTKLKC